MFQHIEVADGRVWLLRSGIDCFARDLTSDEKELVWATAIPPVADLFNQKVEGVAWRSKPSAYIVAANDETVHPDLERAAAKRMGATTLRTTGNDAPGPAAGPIARSAANLKGNPRLRRRPASKD